MKYGYILTLPDGWALCGSVTGNPFLSPTPEIQDKSPSFLVCRDFPVRPNPEYSQAINRWQANPDNDCLRARGDYRWRAACQAEIQCR
jgi:hypothetical protein